MPKSNASMAAVLSLSEARGRLSAEHVDSARARRMGSNWVHEALEEREVDGCGFGAFAKSDIRSGTTLVIYGGRVMTLQEFESLSIEMQNYPYQIEEEILLGPANELDIGVGERLNHSCDPNAGFQGPIHVVALRDIAAGEQVCIDYATCVSSNHDAFHMRCVCGSPGCRGVVSGEDWMLPSVQQRLFPYFQPYLQRKIAAGRAANDDLYEARLKPAPARSGPARFFAWCARFVQQSIRDEWVAIPVSCIAALPSNLATCFIMEYLAPILLSLGLVQDGTTSVALIAAITPIVGYATYLVAYYCGMLVKERRDFIRAGRIVPDLFRKKLSVVWYDFVVHLPSDCLVMPLMGAAQGGFALAGITQFWSIFWAQFFADCAYAWKEPFFWHAAKRLAVWRGEQQPARSGRT